MNTQKFEKNRTFTLNQHEPDQYGNTYTGTVYLNHKPHWLNAKDVNGPNGPFISGYIGKEKQPKAPVTVEEPTYKATTKFEVDPEDKPY
mgnify:CR=1 FL=1